MQVNVGMSPEHVIEREAIIMSQAHAAVNEARSQSASEVNAMRSQIEVVQQQVQSHARNVELQAQVSVEGANARAQAIELRVHDLVSELQTRHQLEINHLQNVANESHHESQQRLLEVQAENQRLLDRIKDQENQLKAQWHEQKELRSVIMGLQDQVGLLRSQPPASPQNGTVDQYDLMQVMLQLQNDVRMLQNRSPIPIVAQPPVFVPIGTPQATSSVIGLSACAGYKPVVPSISKGSGSDGKKGGKSSKVSSIDPLSLTAPTGPGEPSDSSSTSSDSGGNGRGPGGNGPDPGSSHVSEGDYHGNHGNASIGIGSNILGFMSEKDVYRSKDLALVKIENLPTTASEFRAWKNTFLTKVASIVKLVGV
jgi:hypothetical protein